MDEKNEAAGLHLPHEIVHRISGPVSMYYLKPKSGKGPLVLLWGDWHRDDRGLCDEAEAKEGKTRLIYDKDFLKELDALAAEYPIDFYTEYSRDFREQQKESDILFKRFLHDTTRFCHIRGLRTKKGYEERCPTKYIRWHYADPRFMTDTMEHYLTAPILVRMEWIIFVQPPPQSISELHKRVVMFQSVYRSWPTHLQKSRAVQEAEWEAGLNLSGKPKGVDLMYSIVPLQFAMIQAMLTPLKEGGNPRVITLADFDQTTKYHKIFEPYVAYTLEGLHSADPVIRRRQRSVLMKQLTKARPDLGKDDIVEFFANMMRNTLRRTSDRLLRLEYQLMAHMDPLMVEYLKTIFMPRVDALRKLVIDDAAPATTAAAATGKPSLLLAIRQKFGENSLRVMWNGLTWFHQYIHLVEMVFVDLYTMFRMTKPPAGGAPPALALGYFGSGHVEHMMRLLQMAPYFDYEVVFASQPKTSLGQVVPNLRCLTVDYPIRLEEDLRRSHVPEQQALWKNTLYREEAGREANRLFSMNMDATASPAASATASAFPPSIRTSPTASTVSFPSASSTPTASFPSVRSTPTASTATFPSTASTPTASSAATSPSAASTPTASSVGSSPTAGIYEINLSSLLKGVRFPSRGGRRRGHKTKSRKSKKGKKSRKTKRVKSAKKHK